MVPWATQGVITPNGISIGSATPRLRSGDKKYPVNEGCLLDVRGTVLSWPTSEDNKCCHQYYAIKTAERQNTQAEPYALWHSPLGMPH